LLRTSKRKGYSGIPVCGYNCEDEREQFWSGKYHGTVKTLFGDLKKGTGATVISAAGGTEYALEGLNSSNGLFTSCLISGIVQRRTDLDRNRKYTVSELQRYISEQVIRLSNGKQVPTFREENFANDFRVY